MVKRIIGALVGILSLGALALFVVFYVTMPSTSPLSTAKIEATPERLARGKYLAESVTSCVACHSTRDAKKFGGPVIAGTEGKGGERFGRQEGFPGEIYASNISPAGLGSWSDGELVRAMTEGVSKDGRVLFPVMPYPQYRKLCDEDLASLVSWVRSLPAISNDPPISKIDFPVSMFIRGAPQPREPHACPQPSDGVAYGEYVTSIAACADCHTPQERGQPLHGMNFAGGFSFPMPTGVARSANITPDPESGIGAWDRERFVNRFTVYSSTVTETPIGPGDLSTPMPWHNYARMKREDLGAIYDYLRSIPAVANKVERWTSHP